MTDQPSTRRAARAFAVLSLAAALAACGRGKEPEAPAVPEPSPSAPAAAASPPPAAAPAEEAFANAVEDAKATATSGKTAAAVDLQYDVLARPEPGQPFEIELALTPRLPADALEVEVTGIPGLTVVSGGTPRFEKVTPATRYTAKVLVQAEAAGLYYLGVVARTVTQVQTEARAFSVPVVVGQVPAAEKPRPAVDASGQPIQSMPAEEPGGKDDATRQPE